MNYVFLISFVGIFVYLSHPADSKKNDQVQEIIENSISEEFENILKNGESDDHIKRLEEETIEKYNGNTIDAIDADPFTIRNENGTIIPPQADLINPKTNCQTGFVADRRGVCRERY